MQADTLTTGTAHTNGTAPHDDLPPATWLASPDAERGVIAALLLSPEVQDDWLMALTPAHFSESLFGKVFTAIADLRRAGRSADLVTVREKLWQRLGENDRRRIDDLVLSDFLSDNELASAVKVLADRKARGDLKRALERAEGQLGKNEARQTLAGLQLDVDRIGRELRQADDTVSDDDATGDYMAERGIAGTPMLFWRKKTADGITEVRLADFVPRVIGERIRHKASGDTVRVLACELQTARGAVRFDALPEDVTDPRRFFTACINAVGADLVPTRTALPHLPLAALALADPRRERTEVFEFTGWHEDGDRLAYLAAAGALGTEEPLNVDLAGLALGTGVPSLASFGPRDDGDDALTAGLQALGGPVRRSFPDLVTLPGLAAVFLAPLLHWAPTVDRPALHYIGTTGVRKSAWLAILQSFYGLPEPALSWRGTANSIEIALSALRDALVTVDDLKAGTSDRGAGVKIIQSYADRRGRSRATRTGELAKARFVGGLLVSAGEDIPSGEASVAARALFVPIGADDTDIEHLTDAQRATGVLPTVTARYIAWLIGERERLPAVMTDRFEEARARYRRQLAARRGINDAGRVAVNCALLDLGASVSADWLLSVGWSSEAVQEYLEATRAALGRLAILQAEAIGEESAALAFLSALRALIDARRVELAEVEEGRPLPALAGCTASAIGATMIGWRQGDVLWLQPDLAVSETRAWLGKQGKSLPTERGLYAQLKDGGYLAETGDRTTVVRKCGGNPQRVLALRADALSEIAEPEIEEANF